MGFWTLFEVASMPILQVLIISSLGAFMATNYLNLLHTDARKSLNKIVFVVFTPCLMFASLAETVTFEDLVAWWFMPINVALTFLFGGILGWIVVKLLKPKPHLEGLIIATCSAGNLGNILLIIIPAICTQEGSPFGDHKICSTVGLSYASYSMALGGFFIWTYTYHLVRTSSLKYKALKLAEEVSMVPNKDLDANGKTYLLEGQVEDPVTIVVPSNTYTEVDTGNDAILPQFSAGKMEEGTKPSRGNVMVVLHKLLEEVFAPPTIAAILGFVVGATMWLKNLLVGDNAPLRVIQDSVKLLGDGTLPCITLILGGNLIQGLRSARLGPVLIVVVILVRYLFLPLIGIGVVTVAGNLGFLPSDRLYRYVLMLQFALPPAMNIGTMTQLFDVAQEECSVLFLWTYLAAGLSLTAWPIVYMWILS
ncbi:Protein PIN-LIKES like [Actinidia chinensis var. chinensis]|uniref:Protein PIN-LIKES like n=1 Tax=Actinidia chinensis var. chinensis TaxID=1590841 RepID=A0A2R6S2U4_ACTCC|nr:Protein PIN-LIKES like [Actinidia chinensis var. chinensis]